MSLPFDRSHRSRDESLFLLQTPPWVTQIRQSTRQRHHLQDQKDGHVNRIRFTLVEKLGVVGGASYLFKDGRPSNIKVELLISNGNVVSSVFTSPVEDRWWPLINTKIPKQYR
ncbi:hypothetical protein L1987_01156 [Smallanthus sonchifolius]|uniref:Uncharacterized protein n=1 Tax=Smallanthus sonchifolius TaxID=185202 RepID=A0ACB9K4A2_9ASTR|nr:hypothetical protein L1987_01156 [Smallanthus sonchifolius]